MVFDLQINGFRFAKLQKKNESDTFDKKIFWQPTAPVRQQKTRQKTPRQKRPKKRTGKRAEKGQKKGKKQPFATACFPGTIFLPNSTQTLIKFLPSFTLVEDDKTFIKLSIVFKPLRVGGGRRWRKVADIIFSRPIQNKKPPVALRIGLGWQTR